jgi:choline monooxygenase
MAASVDSLTLPFAWYSDEQLLRRERASIFARSWQYAGRAAQVAEPGSYLATDAGGVPILVTRDREGSLRAFVNVCRHRGSVLMEGCGKRNTLQCSYHAWTYDLDGSLRSAPRSERELEFAADDWSLLPASVGTWGPFLFVNPDPAAVQLAEHLGELPAILARAIDIDGLEFHSRIEFGADANWKIVVENFLECYHCPTAHPSFSEEVDVHPDRYLLEAFPASTSSPARRTSRSVRSRRQAPAAPSATSTTSSPRVPTQTGSPTSSRSTTRSVGRTAPSSSRCTGAWPPGWSTRAACS